MNRMTADQLSDSPPSVNTKRWVYRTFVGLVAIVLCLFGLFYVAFVHDAHLHQAEAQLKHLSLRVRLHAMREAEGEYPPLASHEGLWIFDPTLINEMLLDWPEIIVNPCHPTADRLYQQVTRMIEGGAFDPDEASKLFAKSYVYFGWQTRTIDELRAVAEVVRSANIEDRWEDISLGETVLKRLAHQDLFEEDEYSIPVFMERTPTQSLLGTPTHVVAFLDGHTERIVLGEKYPVLPEVFAVIESGTNGDTTLR